jgi:hypothetical protein
MNNFKLYESRSRGSTISLIRNWILENQLQLMKIIIISAVIMLSATVTFVFPPKYLPFLIVMIAAVGALIIYLKYPPLGLIALIVGALLLGYELGTGSQTGLNIAVLLLPVLIGIWFMDMFVRQRRLQIFWSRTYLPLLGFEIISILAFAFGQLPWFVFAHQAPLMSQLGGLAIFILSAGAYVLTANILDLKWLKIITLIFMILAAVYILARIILQLNRSLDDWMPDGATGSLLWIWMVVIPFSQFLFNRDLKVIWRIAVLGLAILVLYVAIFGEFGWKSGWIPPLAAIGMLIWIRYPRLRIFLVIGAGLAVWFMSAELIQSDQYSYITRIEAWKIMLNEIVRVNPLLGLGPANYRFYTPLFPIMGYYVEFNSHNNYIDILAQVGLFGLIAYLWFAWEVFRLGWRLLKLKLDDFSLAYVAGALGGLVGMLVAGMLGDWVLPFVYNVGMRGFRSSILGWIFLGGLVVIERIAANEGLKSQQDDR